ncbi:copper resistance protein CopC [Luteimicrobium sp. NPDC057192]|uniref:copper resistance CopC family protein n=1 Tax=Luteimicrobium sp. NPDC057192 TaxID=3346042 RepID=UPI0036268168
MRRRSLTAALGVLTLVGGLAGTVLVAGPAAAHDYVVSTTPKADSTVDAAVPTVDVTFDDVVLDPQHDGSTTVLQVTDAAGTHFESSCPAVSGRTISVPTALGDAGAYTVTWRIVSADGHPVSGTFGFDYRPAAAVPSSAGQAASPCGGSTAKAGAATSTVTSGSSSVSAGVVVGVVGVVVLLAAAVVVLVTLRARRSLDGADGSGAEDPGPDGGADGEEPRA